MQEERKMRRILLALVALPQWGGWLAQTHAAVATQQGSTDKENSNIANKSLEFVNIIKDDLRRNNDDYVMPEQRSQVNTTPPARPLHPASQPPYRNRILPPAPPPALHMQPSFGQPGPLPKQPSQPGPLPKQPSQPGPLPKQPSQPGPLPKQPSQPGPLLKQPSQSWPLPKQSGPLLNQPGQIRRRLEQPPQELNIEPRRSLNMTMKQTSTAYPFTFKSYTRSTHSSRYKHLRINKLKGLLDKKKHWTRMRQQFEMEDTTSSSPQTTNPTTPQSPDPPPPTRPPPPRPPLFVTNTATSPSPTSAPHYTRSEREQQRPVMRQKPEPSSSPSPDELDMAPARGAQIRDIRFKGRLCQRNLMNMEGPSYDKAGNEVNPPHHPSNSRGRRFYQTRAPKLVLPRCCNCCKKSVLGCQ